uniref:HMA domain-containing protein n=1 Tax=Setaria viridis TaxID=4556 RepID=A0A4U6SZ93_SETVI|nr:hypothetical protein SEVIR_9G240400v2 [Setaria viridis]
MAPVVLSMDVHCDSCAKKIRKAVMKVPGAESVTASFETGLVVVEGPADATALRARLQAMTKKDVKVVSDGAEENGEAAGAGAGSASAYTYPATPILLEMELHCRRGRRHHGRAGAPGEGHRDGRRIGGGDEPRGQDEEARQGRQRPPEARRRPRVRPRVAEGGRGASGGAGDAGDVWGGDDARRAAGGVGYGRRQLQPLVTVVVGTASWVPATRLSASSVSACAVFVVRCTSAAGRLLVPGTTGRSVRRATLGGAGARPTVGRLLYASRRIAPAKDAHDAIANLIRPKIK